MLIAPDSFKGTLSALAAARAIEAGIRHVLPDAITQCLPLADGGEGTLDVLLFAAQGERKSARVTDANGDRIAANYGLLLSDSKNSEPFMPPLPLRVGERGGVTGAQGTIAVLEAAQVAGLAQARIDVAERTTRGLGELLRLCLDQGMRRFLIGLGGSSTNDGGAGLLAAVGVRLLDAAGKVIEPSPRGLAALDRVDFAALDARLAACDLTVLTDVDHPLCGPTGATAVFGPQKGVLPGQVAVFDAAIAHLARLCDAWAGCAVSQQAGAGAAGGLGYALLLLGAKRRPGAEVVCEKMQLDARLRDADWLITGEGKSDAQTLHGKLPLVAAHHAQAARVPAILLSGAIEAESAALLEQKFVKCFSVVSEKVTLDEVLRDPARRLTERAESVANWILRSYSSNESNAE
ncbi:MAG: glycerate kinase [Hydrogenophilales bacterium]|nr:glycerate kinase [Hydrogenophilales bacterium]